MGKKKIEGSIVELDLPPPVIEQKKKKEISEAQRMNLAKGMAALKAKREAKSKAEDVHVEQPVVPPPSPVAAPVSPVAEPTQPKKERKPRVVKNYLTTEDFNSFKSELLTSLKPSVPSAPQTVIQREVVPVAQPVIKERVISGRELLDKIFFK